MSTLPFPLAKEHKRKMRHIWKKRGMIFVDDYHFWYVYNEYIHATNCDLCNKLFLKSTDRQLDHCYDTGDPRNVVCQRCNLIRKDNKIRSDNTSGEKYISKCKHKKSITGYRYQIKIERDGITSLRTASLRTARTTLEAAIIVRDEFIAAHPEIYS